MEGDEEKEKTFRKKQTENIQSIAQAGRTTRFMGGGQTKEGDQTKTGVHPWWQRPQPGSRLPRDHAKYAQAVVGVPTEGPTGQRTQRNAMGPQTHTHTHTPTSLSSFVGFHLRLATITYVLPTAYMATTT